MRIMNLIIVFYLGHTWPHLDLFISLWHMTNFGDFDVNVWIYMIGNRNEGRVIISHSIAWQREKT